MILCAECMIKTPTALPAGHLHYCTSRAYRITIHSPLKPNTASEAALRQAAPLLQNPEREADKELLLSGHMPHQQPHWTFTLSDHTLYISKFSRLLLIILLLICLHYNTTTVLLFVYKALLIYVFHIDKQNADFLSWSFRPTQFVTYLVPIKCFIFRFNSETAC